MYTLEKEVSLEGVGVHSGKKVKLTLKPSRQGKIVFERADLDNLKFQLDPSEISAKNSTVLTSGSHKVQTVEHLLAALYMFGINSLIVELDAEEVPIMDGSASLFVDVLSYAGIRVLSQEKKSLQIKKRFVVTENDASLDVRPSSAFWVSYLIEYDHPAIQVQQLSIEADKERFITEIAPARTFGFLKDAPHLRAQNLALGGSMENVVVLDDREVINGPLRFPDEFVRHKILDIIGDLSLLGNPLQGHFYARKAGHSLHLKAVRFLLDNPDHWSLK